MGFRHGSKISSRGCHDQASAGSYTQSNPLLALGSHESGISSIGGAFKGGKDGRMAEERKNLKDLLDNPEEEVSRRTVLKAGKTVLLTASYVVISVFADRVSAHAGSTCSGCTSGATTVTVPPCSSCTACTGCTGCTKVCTSGCCISCTKCTSQ